MHNAKYLAWLILVNNDNLAKARLIDHLYEHVVGVDALNWRVTNRDYKAKAVCILAVARLGYAGKLKVGERDRAISIKKSCAVLSTYDYPIQKSTYSDHWCDKIKDCYTLIRRWAETE